MKNRLLVTLVLVASSSFAFAGNPDRLISALNLDESQAAEVHRIFDENKERRKAIRQEAKHMMEPLGDADKEERQGIRQEAKLKIQALRETQKEQLSSVLNAEQMAIVEEKMNKKRDKNGKKAHNKNSDDA